LGTNNLAGVIGMIVADAGHMICSGFTSSFGQLVDHLTFGATFGARHRVPVFPAE